MKKPLEIRTYVCYNDLRNSSEYKRSVSDGSLQRKDEKIRFLIVMYMREVMSVMTYDVACPVCGKINHDLYLEETEGWMECECCGHSAQDRRFQKALRVPVLRMDQITKMIPLKFETAGCAVAQ